jgi:branched-chain amino acid transport system permease protein
VTGWYEAHLLLVQSTFTGLLLALSVQFPMRMGVFSFAGVAAYGVGGYMAASLVIERQMTGLLVVLLVTVTNAALGLLVGTLIQRLDGLYLAMASVALTLMVSVVAVNGGELTGGATGLYGVLTDFTTGQLYCITLAVVALVAATEHGAMGRRIAAVREDPELASSVGISVRRYRIAAFVVSGALGGCAGAMNVFIRTTIGPLDIGFPVVVLALTMIIVGGVGSWKGAVLGAVVFTWLPEALGALGDWQHVVYGIIVAIAAVWLPGGMYGFLVEARRSLQRKRRRVAVPRGGAEEAGAHGEELEIVERLSSGRWMETRP